MCSFLDHISHSREVGGHPPLGEYLIHDNVVVHGAWRANGAVRL